MSAATIEELAASIATNTKRVSEYLASKNLPPPSFNVDAPSTSQVADAPEIEGARIAVINDTLTLRDLMLGPREYLMSFTHDELISMQAIIRFNLASAVPIYGAAKYADIAKTAGLSEVNTRRLMRHAMTKRLFSEPQKGTVVHTAASRLIAEDPQVADWVGANADELWQSASQTVPALVKFNSSEEPHQTGFALANNSDQSAFAILAANPSRARRFGNAMRNFTQGPEYDLKHLSNGFDWSALGAGTVVDCGGSNGFACIQLAEDFIKLKCVNQDLGPVMHGAEEAVPPAIKDRVTFMPYDFIKDKQPVHGADVYLFRRIFHNWSDKYCGIILQNLIPALKPGATLLIMDNVLPDRPGMLPNHIEERIRSMDLTMMEMQNSRERDLDDWKALFAAQDSRFKFKSAHLPTGSRLWLIEVQWDG